MEQNLKVNENEYLRSGMWYSIHSDRQSFEESLNRVKD